MDSISNRSPTTGYEPRFNAALRSSSGHSGRLVSGAQHELTFSDFCAKELACLEGGNWSQADTA